MFTDLEKIWICEFYSLSTSLRVRIILFPTSQLSTPLHPTPPPSKKKGYGGFLVGWNGNFLAWHSKLFTSSMFSVLSPMVLFVHFLSGPQGCFGPQHSCVFTPPPLCSGCSPGCPLSYPVYLTNPVHSSRSSWNVACLHISLCILFPHSLSPPPLLPYTTL